MQKVITAALAVPVLVLVYAGTLVRRAGRAPVVMALVAVALTGVLIATAVHPVPASGTLPARQAPLDPSEFSAYVQTGESPSAPIVISFSKAMNTQSVERLVRIDPATAVAFSWDSSATSLSISPRDSWAPGTFHTVTIEAGALEATGRPLEKRIRSVFLTREAVVATISVTGMAEGVALPTTHFAIAFTGPVDLASLHLDITPAVAGHLVPAVDSLPAAPTYEFVPEDVLQTGATYTIALDGARDVDGARIAGTSATVNTAAVPTVVRFRPINGSLSVGWSQNLSVRFAESMDRATTEQAWSAVQAGTSVAGTFSWAEQDTVLVFNPKAALGYSQKVVLTVGTGATSKAGLPLGEPATATFTTSAKPVAKKITPSASTGGASPGGAIGASTWSAVEAYYLQLMNCTRQGGVVTSTGACSSPGGRAVAALWQDAGITSRVSRPYAKKLAVNNLCTHFSGGTPGTRLQAAGFSSYIWAENLGCRSGDPYAAVLGSHLFFQSEKSYLGGHYVHLMDAAYDRVGIGVWVSSGRVRLVVDFYHPK